MMSALPETDIWTLTLRLPASYCGSYSLLEIPGTTAETIALSEAVLPPSPERPIR